MQSSLRTAHVYRWGCVLLRLLSGYLLFLYCMFWLLSVLANIVLIWSKNLLLGTMLSLIAIVTVFDNGLPLPVKDTIIYCVVDHPLAPIKSG